VTISCAITVFETDVYPHMPIYKVLFICHDSSPWPTESKVRPSSGTDVYPHMPILRPHTARTW